MDEWHQVHRLIAPVCLMTSRPSPHNLSHPIDLIAILNGIPLLIQQLPNIADTLLLLDIRLLWWWRTHGVHE